MGRFDDLQVTVRVPGVSRRTATYVDSSLPPRRRRPTRATATGDASASLLGVAAREAVGRPNAHSGASTAPAIGPGDCGLGGGIAVSKSYDPAVLFAGVSYLYGLSTDASTRAARLQSRTSECGARLYVYALNDSLALNTVLSGAYRNALPDGVAIPPSRALHCGSSA